MRLFACLLAGFIALQAGPAAAQPQDNYVPDTKTAVSLRKGADRKPIVAVTEHKGVFNGEEVSYTATVKENFFYNDAGEPLAYLTTIAYVRTDVADAASRPVMFLFNGGPGASSSPLHMGAFGPKRRGDEGLEDNAFSLLNEVDLVFIDPVGTGFSRIFDDADGPQFWGRSADAKSVKEAIVGWLEENGRMSSPRYLAGQSYGTIRAPVMLKNHPDLTFDGVLLFALVNSAEGLELPFVAALPTMATTAWHYEKIKRKGRSVDAVFEEAVEFARTDYLEALFQGASLPAAQKKKVAARMSELIGLPAALIEEKDLRIDKTTFMFEIIKDRGLRTGLLDTRVTAERDLSKMTARDDPALGGGRTRGAGGQRTSLEDYFIDTLKFDTPEKPYHGVNFDVNFVWDHEGWTDVMPAIGEAMAANKDMRVFWVGGYYDLTTPAYGAEYVVNQSGAPPDRVVSALFPGAHSVFYEDENREALAKAVIKFVTGE
jgi:carboxypeptidase C (cathepsin A)